MGVCDFCGEDTGILPFLCKRCKKQYCSKHRLPENHNCSFEFEVSLPKKKGSIARKQYVKYDQQSNKIKIKNRRFHIFSERSRGYSFHNETTIWGIIGAGALIVIIALFSPIGMYTIYEAWFVDYSEVVFIWYFGVYATFESYEGELTLKPGPLGIDMKMFYIGLLAITLMVFAIYLIIKVIILEVGKKRFPYNTRIIMTISGLIFIFAPILWYFLNIFFETSFYRYSEFVLLFLPIIGGITVLVGVILMRQ